MNTLLTTIVDDNTLSSEQTTFGVHTTKVGTGDIDLVLRTAYLFEVQVLYGLLRRIISASSISLSPISTSTQSVY